MLTASPSNQTYRAWVVGCSTGELQATNAEMQTKLDDLAQAQSDMQNMLNSIETLVVCEKQVATNEGRWFSIRIMPYRRLDNVIDGAVMTMADITDTKTLESSLREESGNKG